MVALTTLPVVNSDEIAKIDTAILKKCHISHAELMEEAAKVCVDWLIKHYDRKTSFLILCGTGNNGGDGLVIARRLFMAGYSVRVHADQGKEGSLQVQQYQRTARLLPISSLSDDWASWQSDVVIDALFGVGLQGAVRAPYDRYIETINMLDAKCIAIDMPSGLTDERITDNLLAVHADTTLSLCTPKHSQLWACHERFIGNLHVLPLPYAQTVLISWSEAPQWLTREWITSQQHALQRFAHKGNFGHVAIAAGSQGMVGAAIMAASACLRSGAGLTTLHIAEKFHLPIHAALPEVMLTHNLEPVFQADVLALGPGWGQNNERKEQLMMWLNRPCQGRVIDADALNLLAEQKIHLCNLSGNTILTPHPREFSRLTGVAIPENSDRIRQASDYAKAWGVTVVLKGKYTVIAGKNGSVWINPTGNSALAKGGSGDVLTGMIAGYLAQGHDSETAALLAVYRHGLAADLVVSTKNTRAVLARDIIEMLAQLPN